MSRVDPQRCADYLVAPYMDVHIRDDYLQHVVEAIDNITAVRLNDMRRAGDQALARPIG